MGRAVSVESRIRSIALRTSGPSIRTHVLRSARVSRQPLSVPEVGNRHAEALGYLGEATFLGDLDEGCQISDLVPPQCHLNEGTRHALS
jgi:hypothetical protein